MRGMMTAGAGTLLALATIGCSVTVEPGKQADGGADAAAAAMAADTEAVRAASLEWDRRFTAGDAAGVGALYAEGAFAMPYDAPTIEGRPALQAYFVEFLGQNAARHETAIDEVLIAGDRAIERGHYLLTFTPRAGGDEMKETGRHVVCRQKIGGQWLIVWEIWNKDTP